MGAWKIITEASLPNAVSFKALTHEDAKLTRLLWTLGQLRYFTFVKRRGLDYCPANLQVRSALLTLGYESLGLNFPNASVDYTAEHSN